MSPDPLNRVIHRCLAKDSSERYPDGARLSAELEAILASDQDEPS